MKLRIEQSRIDEIANRINGHRLWLSGIAAEDTPPGLLVTFGRYNQQLRGPGSGNILKTLALAFQDVVAGNLQP